MTGRMTGTWLAATAALLFALCTGCGDASLDRPGADAWTFEDGGGGADTGTDQPDTGTEQPDTDIERPDTHTPPPDGGGGCRLPEPEEHRAAPQKCSGNPPRGEVPDDARGQCTSHADCDGKNARCVASRGGYMCTSDECMTDADCGSGEVCECGGSRHGSNVCLPSQCQTDADCGPGGYCSPSFGSCGNYTGVVGYFCHTCEDECTDDSDCGSQDGGYGAPYCMYDQQAGKWVCSSSHCVG